MERGHGRGPGEGSAEIAGLQGRIGLVDDLQFLLGDLVAAMRVGMVLLDQHLVARLEAHFGEWWLDVKNRERLLACRGGTGNAVRAAVAIVAAAAMTVGVSVGMAIA